MVLLNCISCGARTKALSRFLVLASITITNLYLLVGQTARKYYGYDNATINIIMPAKNITSMTSHNEQYDVSVTSWQPTEHNVMKISGEQLHSLEYNNSTALATVDIDTIIAQHVHALNQTEYKFFMYDDPNITLIGPSVWPEGTKLLRKAWRMCSNEILFDESLFVVLEHSPLRTFNPDEAQVFIAPIPIGRIFATWIKDVFWRLSFNSLTNHEVFRKHQGHKHLMIATCFPLFKDYRMGGSIAEHYDKLENMTLVQSWDPNGIKKALDDGYDFHEYQEYFTNFQPITHSSISVGLGTRPNSSVIPLPDFKIGSYEKIPLVLASMEKWRNASNFVFYHTRTTPSFFANSTIYRHVAVTNVTMSNLPKSSIGWDMASNEQWLKEYMDSKFCLVIRGDSPHSKAFIRSIRVGCIPVIVADCLPIYAPVLKSTLNMSDYAVMLDEKKFVENPESQLLTLLDLDESEISNKIKHLAFAQKVMMLDHPGSLFVPALLHEAVETFKNV